MRTTVTLDDDVVAALRTMERERGISFKEALNSSVRAALLGGGFSRAPSDPFAVDVFEAEIQPGIDLRRANRLVADLEDEELLRKIEFGR